jgi:signal transduction histidine kinase
MPTFRPSGPWRYALSLATIAAAVLLAWPLRTLQDISAPLFVLAVLVSAWYGGPGPAALAAVLSVIAADFFFIAPIFSVELNLAFVERSLAFALVLGVVIWFTDVRKRAELKLLEQAERLRVQAQILEAAKEDLKQADRMKDEFLAVLSHELRNPLGAIRNGLHLMAADGVKDRDRIQAMMERQMKQLLRLMEDLLDVSRITRGKMDLRSEHIELANLVRDAVDSSRTSIDAKGHELTVTLPTEAVHIEGDRERLAQVLSNILGNAAKFTPRGGRIGLDATREDGILTIRVRDSGIGIPAHMVGRVFELFTQADRSTSREYGGLGIGLSLARGLVEAHGGSVEARSEGPGKGAEIVVRLPAEEAGVPV